MLMLFICWLYEVYYNESVLTSLPTSLTYLEPLLRWLVHDELRGLLRSILTYFQPEEEKVKADTRR